MRVVVLILAACLIGCAQERAYHVTVRNATEEPITMGFVKDGPPMEAAWLSPEETTDIPPSRRPSHWGMVVPAGKVVSAGMRGTFEQKTHAILRIYLGDEALENLLAKSRSFGDRTELRLVPAEGNYFVVTAPGGKILARAVNPGHPR